MSMASAYGVVTSHGRCGGLTESIYGSVYDGISVDTTPSVSEDAARMAFSDLEAELPADRRIELVVLPRDEGGYALTWRTHVWTNEGWMHTFIDAHTGTVALKYNDLQTESAVGTGTGVLGDRKKISTRRMAGRFVADDQMRPPVLRTYDMRGNLDRTTAVLYRGFPLSDGDLAGDSDNAWTDGADVDAHVHIGWTYDYLVKRFGRRGLDDNDAPIRGITHPVRRSDLPFLPASAADFVLNAFWCGGCGPDGLGAMMFGEGLPPGYSLSDTGQYVDYLAGALDVVAHELTHALTTYSSNLAYRNESGALNESFSDVLGTSTEFFYAQTGAHSRQAEYLIGEDVIRPGGIRSMATPVLFGDPDHYSRRYRGILDGGGVHTNSGIPNHAFYLAIEGGVNRTSGLRVTGVGAANREQIEKAFYRAFVYKLTSRATFSSARAATIDAARELYGIRRTDAPIFIRPEAVGTPLQTLQRGAQVRVQDIKGDWLMIEFRDSRWGTRVGWVQRKLTDW
jgi:thermolysin